MYYRNNKVTIAQMINKIKGLIFNKSFLIGFCIAVGLFSHYIFGHDNIYEQFVEKFIYNNTGYEVDFTPHDSK